MRSPPLLTTSPLAAQTSATLIPAPTQIFGIPAILLRLAPPFLMFPKFPGTTPAPAPCFQPLLATLRPTARPLYSPTHFSGSYFWRHWRAAWCPVNVPPERLRLAELLEVPVQDGPSPPGSRSSATPPTACATPRTF